MLKNNTKNNINDEFFSASLINWYKKNKRDLPAGVPEENVYENTHILLYVFYAIAVASVILLLVNQ